MLFRINKYYRFSHTFSDNWNLYVSISIWNTSSICARCKLFAVYMDIAPTLVPTAERRSCKLKLYLFENCIALVYVCVCGCARAHSGYMNCSLQSLDHILWSGIRNMKICFVRRRHSSWILRLFAQRRRRPSTLAPNDMSRIQQASCAIFAENSSSQLAPCMSHECNPAQSRR